MVKILAVSDHELVNKKNEKIKKKVRDNIDILIGCGDLSPGYLEYLIDTFRPPERIMVYGNHDKDFITQKKHIDTDLLKMNYNFRQLTSENKTLSTNGYSDTYQGMYVLNKGTYLIEKSGPKNVSEDIVIGGFSGALAHGQSPFYFKEKDAKKFYNELSRKKKMPNLLNDFEGIDIMISHSAPNVRGIIPDVDSHHITSRWLGNIFEEFKPKLWLYGHIHPFSTKQDLSITIDEDGESHHIINAIPFKIIDYDEVNKKVRKIY